MDPTNFAYVMNSKGELLSIAEVREYLVKNKPLMLNADANINHHPITREEYLFNYMAKNLYAFQCYSNRDGESESNLLLPVEYNGVFSKTAAYKPKLTNNPNKFWAKPE
jgi:hypothetical protein